MQEGAKLEGVHAVSVYVEKVCSIDGLIDKSKKNDDYLL
jgi:hypothetical protein